MAWAVGRYTTTIPHFERAHTHACGAEPWHATHAHTCAPRHLMRNRAVHIHHEYSAAPSAGWVEATHKRAEGWQLEACARAARMGHTSGVGNTTHGDGQPSPPARGTQ